MSPWLFAHPVSTKEGEEETLCTQAVHGAVHDEQTLVDESRLIMPDDNADNITTLSLYHGT